MLGSSIWQFNKKGFWRFSIKCSYTQITVEGRYFNHKVSKSQILPLLEQNHPVLVEIFSLVYDRNIILSSTVICLILRIQGLPQMFLMLGLEWSVGILAAPHTVATCPNSWQIDVVVNSTSRIKGLRPMPYAHGLGGGWHSVPFQNALFRSFTIFIGVFAFQIPIFYILLKFLVPFFNWVRRRLLLKSLQYFFIFKSNFVKFLLSPVAI